MSSTHLLRAAMAAHQPEWYSLDLLRTVLGELAGRPGLVRPAACATLRGELSRAGEPIRLTDVEASLLHALAQRAGEILSREELIELTGASGGGRAVDVQVTRLRRKIEQNPKLPRYLRTVRGKGYVLRPD